MADKDKIEFKRDKETGVVYAYKNGKKIGSISYMSDNTKNK